MTKWSRRAYRYTVRISYDKLGRAKATVPAPLVHIFGKPDILTFEIEQEYVTAKFEKTKVQAADTS